MSSCFRFFLIKSIVIFLFLSFSAGLPGAEQMVDPMENLASWESWPPEPVPVEHSAAPDTYEGTAAMYVDVIVEDTTAILSRGITPDVSWNDFDGMTFWVKGDGSANWACFWVQAGSWDDAWIATFPLTNTEWHKVGFAWSDFVPVALLTPELNSQDGCRPDDFNEIFFAKRSALNTIHECPVFSFSVDSLKLETDLTGDRPRVAISGLADMSGIISKLESGQPVTILALGDSITWGQTVGGNDSAYPALLKDMLAAYYSNDQIQVVNRSIGGSTTSKARQWLKRDVCGVEADLVIVMFGSNEKPPIGEHEVYTPLFIANLVNYIEEAAGSMSVPPACIPLATIPGREEHWTTLDPYAQAVRDLGASNPNLLVGDVNGYFKAMGMEAYAAYMSDEAHPNALGQEAMSQVLFDAITAYEESQDPGDQPGSGTRSGCLLNSNVCMYVVGIVLVLALIIIILRFHIRKKVF